MDTWITAMADRLEGVIGRGALGDDDGYDREACERLARAMYDLQLDGRAAGLSPGQQLLLALLREQPNIGEAEALVLAGALPRLNMRRLLLYAAEASDLLDVNRTTLLRRRWDGDIRAVLLSMGERATGAWYALWQLLHVLAYQRQRPHAGGPVHGWPSALD